VTGLRQSSGRGGLVWVYLDGERVARLRVSDVEELGLRRGLKLGEALKTEVMIRAQRVEAWEYAVRLLGLRSRSRVELGRCLKTRKLDQSIVEAVLDELERLGYLDDREYARRLAEEAVKTGRLGPAAIRVKLRQQGISDEVAEDAVEKAMAGADEEELALRVAEKRLRSMEGLERHTRRRRLQAFLGRRGFSGEIIYNVLQRVIPAED